MRGAGYRKGDRQPHNRLRGGVRSAGVMKGKRFVSRLDIGALLKRRVRGRDEAR